MMGEKGGRETWDVTGEEEEADIEERGEERDPLIPQLSSKPQLASTFLNMAQHAPILIMNSYPVARSSLLALVRSLSHFVTRSSRKDLLIHTSSNSVTYKHIQSGHRPERAGPRHHSHNYSDIPRPRGLGSNRKNWR